MDGKGCECFARCEADCICDADWTPEEVVRLRAENQALREALECIAGGEIYPREVAREALAAKGE